MSASLPPDRDETRLGDATGTGDADTAAAYGYIGPYRVIGVLGEGGMGRVYEAEQASPRRRVALKVIRGSLVDDVQIRMFLREAETLGRLEHPNIGAIYESGRTADGQHYFAMELVRGRTLDAFLRDRGPLDAAELRFRLTLFGVIADAVHYAHQRGVIHRDLKPSNAIVATGTESSMSSRRGTAVPTVKILDFGLARLADTDLATTATDVGVIKGTLAYMSPEQARGSAADVDVRSDVYALGVVLYEMLTGRRPYDTQRGSLLEVVRVICEDAPAPLSGAWPGPARLDPDIATIIGKALEKDPARRYASAAAMSEDVGRYLTAQPILARPPSTVYQLRRFAQRHRGLVASVAAILAVVVAGAGVATWQAVRATRAEALASRRADDATAAQAVAERRRVEAEAARALADQRRQEAEAATAAAEVARRAEANARAIADERRRDAERATAEAEAARARESAERQRADASAVTARDEAAKAQAINTFLTADLLASIMPSTAVGRGRDVSMREVIDEAARRIGDPALAGNRFNGQPLVEASIRITLGRTYRVLGEYGPARTHLERALDLRQRALGRTALDTQDVVSELGALLDDSGRPADAEPLLREVLRERTAQHAPPLDIAKAQANLGMALAHQRQYADAESLLRAAEAALDGLPDAPPEVVFGTHNNLATVLIDVGRPEEARQVLEDARRALIASVGADAPATLIVNSNLANAYRQLGRTAEAEQILTSLLPAAQRVAGASHPSVLLGQANLAAIWNSLGKLQQTVAELPAVYDLAKTAFGPSHPTTRLVALVLGEAYGRTDRADLALPLLTDSVASFRQDGTADSVDGIMARTALVRTLVSLDRARDARQDADALATLVGRIEGANSLPAVLARQLYAMVLSSSGDRNTAEPILVACVDALPAFGPDGLPARVEGTEALAGIRMSQGRAAEAVALLTRARSDAITAFGATDTRTLLLTARLGNIMDTREQAEAALAYLREAADGLAKILGPSNPIALGPLFDQWWYARRIKPSPEAQRLEARLVPGYLQAAARPNASVDTLIRASVLRRQAVTRQARDLADAWRLAERAAAFDPHIGSVWAIIAETAAANKRWGDAAHALEKAIALTPPGPGRTRLQAALTDVRGKVK